MPKCMLCGEEHKVITNTHLKYFHDGMTSHEYEMMFPGCELFSWEVRQTIGPPRGSVVSEETRRLLSLNHAGGKPLGYVHSSPPIREPHSEDTKRLISEGNRRFWSSPKGRELISKRERQECSEETRKKVSEAQRGRKHTEEAKQRISKALTGRVFDWEWRQKLSKAAQSLWDDPEYAEKQQLLMHQGMRKRPWNPSMPELLLSIVLEEEFPGVWIYNGTGSLTVGKYVPDFVRSDGTRQIIEVFGEYWHPEEDEFIRMRVYKSLGYDCLVLWESSIWTERPQFLTLVGNLMKGGS